MSKAIETISEVMILDLIQRAKAASEFAYCPYSHFRVGAALLTAFGEIYVGCNVENGSYGLTICGERNAIFQMVAREHQRQIVALAIYTPTEKPSAPCGACRQVIHEFGPEALIICVCDGTDVIRSSMTELFPVAFGGMNLGRSEE